MLCYKTTLDFLQVCLTIATDTATILFLCMDIKQIEYCIRTGEIDYALPKERDSV